MRLRLDSDSDLLNALAGGVTRVQVGRTDPALLSCSSDPDIAENCGDGGGVLHTPLPHYSARLQEPPSSGSPAILSISHFGLNLSKQTSEESL